VKQVRISPTALVEQGSKVGEGTSIWHNAQIRADSEIGDNCIIGKDVYIGVGVRVGKDCKIQNGAQIYEPAILGDGIFIGPQVILTNDRAPRAINADGTLKSFNDWNLVGVVIENGASVGANSTCIAPLRIGMWAMVGAGSVVTKDVPNYALVVGNPARQIGWVGESGARLRSEGANLFKCPMTGSTYTLVDANLSKLSP
jgi:UDP-2-acetamido-3-amino-2,3-dideoxy-glucuronate N-acetyltransferase